MKPILLNICGWGPYKELQTVEFNAFHERGVFLIAGPTGAGKTTIFDAITYALYGNVSGTMREKDTLRSDFADADTVTYVELTFTHMGNTYRVYRNPEYTRPKKRKTGKEDFTKEKEKAVIYLPDETVVEGNSETNRKIEEILCMDYRQFKQISMIAQGEFIRLLMANQKEKTEIFREIFDTVFCESFTQTIKKKALLLGSNIANLRAKMEEIIEHVPVEGDEWEAITQKGAYHYEYISDLLKMEEKKSKDGLKKIEKDLSLLEIEIEKLWKETEERKNNLLLFQKKEVVQKEYREHILFEAVHEMKKERMQKGKKAQHMIVDEIKYLHAKKQYEEISVKIESLYKELEQAKEAGEKYKETYEKKDEIEKLLESLSAYKVTLAEEEKQSLFLQQVQEELQACQTKYLTLESKYKKKQEDYSIAQECYKRAMIGIVAKMVVKGEPCPVCGATIHPHIATLKDNTPEEAELETLKKETQDLYAESMQYYAKAVTINKAQESSMLLVEELKNKVFTQKQKMEAKEDLLAITLLENIIQKSDEEITIVKKKFKSEMEEETRRQAEVSAKQHFLENLHLEKERAEKKKEESSQEFEVKLKQTGYASLKDFAVDKMTEEEMKTLEIETKEYEQKKHSLFDYVQRLEVETKGLSKALPEELKPALEEKKSEKALLIKASSKYRVYMTQVKEAGGFLQEKRKHMQTLEAEYGIVGELESMVSGRNAKRLLFEQFVLMGYFDAVLEAANIRMTKMTMGRFALHRARGSSDGRKRDNLEIEVIDHYTGKYRPVKTLSGGEIFNTSLALALGLSDVIQLNNGGVNVETLFIDEGFGALDEQSLEKACETLLHLTQKSCLIGIISHVQEMKEKIGNQIIVEKSNAGSTIHMQTE